jgi:hypothetical protein
LGGGDRLDGFDPGFYVVSTAFSIDEGDAWYFRVSDGVRGSDRLHVVYRDRTTQTGWAFDGDIDFMLPFRLVDTADPDGLAVRARMLAEGWTLEPEDDRP